MFSSSFSFVFVFFLLFFSLDGHSDIPIFNGIRINNRLIVDVGVEGAGHHLIGHFYNNLFSCSQFLDQEEKMGAIGAKIKLNNSPNNHFALVPNNLDFTGFNILRRPHSGSHANFNPLILDGEMHPPHDMMKDSYAALTEIQNLDEYKEGVTVMQTLCSWPCGASKNFPMTLTLIGELVEKLNYNKPPKEWELGVLILIRDPKESIVSHSRQYIVNPMMQTNLTRIGYDVVTTQLNGIKRQLGKKFLGFAFSADLITNLHSILHVNEEDNKNNNLKASNFNNIISKNNNHKRFSINDFNSLKNEASQCLIELSHFFREKKVVVSCALEKTARSLKSHDSYGKLSPYPDFLEEFFNLQFKEQDNLWPDFASCMEGKSECLIPSSCLPFLNRM